MLIPITKIEVGERLRSHLDPAKLRELADDMERNGQLQEIVVAIEYDDNTRSTTIKKATLIAGYRRLEAAKLLGWTEIRCTNGLGGDIDMSSKVDLLRIEFSENELRENFTEMERIAYGIKLKERIAAEAQKRMLSGKKADFDYDSETGYKVWNEDQSETSDDPTPNLGEGADKYSGGEVGDFIAQKIGMGREKFRQGEYILNNATTEQKTAIDKGEATISGIYKELRPTPIAPPVQPLSAEPPIIPTQKYEVQVAEKSEPTSLPTAAPPLELLQKNKPPTQVEYDTLTTKKDEFVGKYATAEHKREMLETQLHNTNLQWECERAGKNDRITELEAKVAELETALAVANARIKELEGLYESDKCNT